MSKTQKPLVMLLVGILAIQMLFGIAMVVLAVITDGTITLF